MWPRFCIRIATGVQSNPLVTFLGHQVRSVTLSKKHHVRVGWATLGMHANNAALVPNEALHRRLTHQNNTLFSTQFSKIAVENRAQNGETRAEHRRVAQCSAEHRVAVVKKKPTLD